MTDDTPTADGLDPTDHRIAVRDRYGAIADSNSGDCCRGSDCGDEGDARAAELGYTPSEIDAVGDVADQSLGCGNPTAIASLDAGDTVLDLGSGAGFDCFLAAQAVGPDGHVLGVDMTPEMLETARENAAENDVSNVEFRLGEIEHLPVADASVDVVISNCVVNLSPDKRRVFEEAFRVLRPGGHVAIADVVQTAHLPVDIASDPEALAACIAGAEPITVLERLLIEVGFTEVAIDPKAESDAFIREWDPERDPSEYIQSATIQARKPTTE